MAKKFLGTHIIAEFYGCEPDLLDDADFITRVLLDAARKTRVTVVDYVTRKFEPQGVSVVVIISESHITIHTWPELGYAAVDFYTCGEEDPEPAVKEIADAFKTTKLTLFRVDRGNMEKIKQVYESNKRKSGRNKKEVNGRNGKDECGKAETDQMQVLL